MFEDVGDWDKEPIVNEEEKKKSQEIDEQLKQDRIDRILSECSVLILSANQPQADASRYCMAMRFAEKLDCKDVITEEHLEYIEIEGKVGSSTIKATSHICSKKNKASQMKLAASDPSVLVYVISAECKGETSSEKGTSLAKSLQKALAHLLFTCFAIGDLKQTAVCLVFSNCKELRKTLDELKDDKEFFQKLTKNFVGIKSHDSDHIFEEISKELEKAVISVRVKQVETIFVEEKLEADTSIELTTSSLSGGSTGSSVEDQMLGIIDSVQQGRVKEVKEKNIESLVENVRPREPVPVKDPPIPLQQGGFDFAQVGLVGVIVAVLVMLIVKEVQNIE